MIGKDRRACAGDLNSLICFSRCRGRLLARNGRSARTLAKGKGMTAVLTAVRAGWRDSRTRGAWPRRHRASHRGGHCRGTREPSISHAGLGPDAIHRTRQKAPGFGCGRCRVPLAYRIPVLRRRWSDGGGCAPQKVDPALIARVRPTIVGCFWPVFFFADHSFPRASFDAIDEIADH